LGWPILLLLHRDSVDLATLSRPYVVDPSITSINELPLSSDIRTNARRVGSWECCLKIRDMQVNGLIVLAGVGRKKALNTNIVF